MTPAELQAWAHGCAHRLLCMWERAGGCGGGKDCQAFPTEIQAAAAALVSAYQEGHAACLDKVRTYADDVGADGLDDDAATARVIADMIEEGSL